MKKFNPNDFLRPGLEEEEIQEIKDVFDIFDSNYSGVITVVELIDAMKAMKFDINNPDIFQMITDMEENEESGIDFQNFLEIMTVRLSSEEFDLEKIFDLIDYDKTGYISDINIRQLGDQLGERFSDEEIANIVKGNDLDKDGKVTFNDFKDIMRMKTFGK